MAFDFNRLLSGPPSPERWRLIREDTDAKYADFGRAVQKRMERATFARVVMMLLLSKRDSAEIIDALTAYVNEGRMPWQK